MARAASPKRNKPKPMTFSEFIKIDEEDETVVLLEHAKSFVVTQIFLGGFRKGGKNFTREEVPSLKKARELAKKRHEETGKVSIIHAVADFGSLKDFSRPVEYYPSASRTPKQVSEENRKKKMLERKAQAAQVRAAKAAAKPKPKKA